MKNYQTIPISRALGLLNDETCVVVDVRDEQSFRRGHLPGAVRFTKQFLQLFKKLRQIQNPILIYSDHGIVNKDVVQMFCDIGCTTVYSLEGGFSAWISENRAIPIQCVS